jgi:hypothetical protein
MRVFYLFVAARAADYCTAPSDELSLLQFRPRAPLAYADYFSWKQRQAAPSDPRKPAPVKLLAREPPATAPSQLGRRRSAHEAFTMSGLHARPLPANVVDKLRSASGIYEDGARPSALGEDPDLPQSVFLTMSSMRTLDLLRNFLCSARRLRLQVVVFALDGEVAEALGGETTVVWDGDEEGLDKHVDIVPANFGDRTHNIAMFYKAQLIGRVLASGFNVVFHDCDIVLFQDPIPHILPTTADFRAAPLRPGLWPKVSDPLRVNTGQLWVRTNWASAYLIDTWINGMMEDEVFTRRVPHMNDQDVFNLLLNQSGTEGIGTTPRAGTLAFRKAFDEEDCVALPESHEPRLCPLSPTHFQLNCYHSPEPPRKTSATVSLHLDCISTTAQGKNPKIEKAKEYGIWYEPFSDCAPKH